MLKLSRRSTLAALGGGLAAPFVRPSWAQTGSVNVYNWADYIGETVLADFEAETGIAVVYDNYASTEEMEAKMLAGSTGYDVVFNQGASMPRFIAAGVYQTLDRARLTGWGNLDPTLLTILEGWDPGTQYSVPYMWGSVGFTFNLDMIQERLPDADLSDLSILFDPANAAKLADCGISVLDSPTDIMMMAMAYLGLDPNTSDPAEYDKVVALFAPVREHIRTFDNNSYINAIPNGELCLINSWSGDYGVASARAAEAGIELNLSYLVPKTGAPIWLDMMVMPIDAPNPDNAYLFLNYMLRPEVAAACTNTTYYANANLASKAFVEPFLLEDPAVYPDDATIARMWTPKPLSAELERALNRAWQAIKTG